MRRPLAGLALLSGALATFAAFAACTATGDLDPSRQEPADPTDSGSTVLGDADVQARDASPDEGLGETPTCSPAGWCQTELPASELSLTDVWPVGSRAFAIATSAAQGIKYLEWDATGGWKFIDKKLGFGNLVSPANVWAPDEDEVFVALTDLSGFIGGGKIGALVMRGTRPTPPEMAWSWTRSRIDCPDLNTTRVAPTLWGVSRDEVYTAVCGNVYRLNRNASIGDAGVDDGDAGEDGGTTTGDGWDLEYTDGDPQFHSWQAIAGTGTGDVWFAGARAVGLNQCVVLIRKTSEGYSTVIDGVPKAGETCVAKDGIAMIPGRLHRIDAPAKDRLVAVHALGWSPEIDNDMIQVAVAGAEVQIERASPKSSMDVVLTDVWATSLDELWVLASRTQSGPGIILRASSPWEDAGKFEFSTLAINGAPNTSRLSRIRGTSKQNIWAVGGDRAYFKSTP